MSFRRMMLFALGGSLVNTIIENLKNFISIITLKNGVTFEAESCSVSGLTSLQDSNLLESANFILLPNNSSETKILPTLPVPTDDVRNLIFRSEGSVTSWSNNAITMAAFTGTTDPFGGVKAVRIIEAASTVAHTFSQGMLNVTGQIGARFSFSAYLKKGVLGAAPDILQLSYTNAYVNYNITTGVITSSGTTAGFSVGGSIENAGSGWWRCIMTGTTTTLANTPSVFIGFTNNNPTAILRPSYLGATTRDLFVYGAQFETSLSATTYQRNEIVPRLSSQYASFVSPTFGNYWVNSSGNLQNTPYENIIYPSINISSQNTGTASRWLRSGLADTTSGFLAPDGTLTASRMNLGGTTNAYYLSYQSSGNNSAAPSFQTSKIRTLIMYVKQGVIGRYLGITLSNGVNGNFYNTDGVTIKIDTADGSLVNNPTAYTINYTSQSIGDGWYKVCVNRADAWDSISLVTNSTLATMTNSQDGVLIWNVQVLDGVYDINTPIYPREIGYSIPRLDYSNSSCPEYLIERSMYNSMLNSENFTAATWVRSAMTVTTNTEIAPNLELAADTLTATGSTASIRQSGAANITVITPRIFSVYMKRKTGTGNVSIDMGTTSTNVNLTTTGWTRSYVVDATLSGTYTVTSGNYTITTSIPHGYLTGFAVHIDFTTGGGADFSINAITVTGPTTFTFTNGSATSSGNCTVYSNTGRINLSTSGDEVYVWGAQIESSNVNTTSIGRVPSSYIPTTTTLITRSADTLITNFSGGSSSSLFFEIVKIGGSGNFNQNFLYIGNETSSVLATDGLGLCGVSNGSITFSKRENNGLNTSIINPLGYTPIENSNLKILFTTSGNTVNLWMDGSLVSRTTFSTPNNLKYITFDGGGGGSSYIRLKNISSWPITLNQEDVDKLFSYPYYDAGYSPVNYELQNVINRAYAEGFTIPSTTILGYCDSLITEMKNDGVWNLTDLFSNFAYNDISLSGFSRINWKNPNSKYIGISNLFGGLTYQTNGFKGNGTDAYINTLVNALPTLTIPYNYTVNNAGRMMVFSEDVISGQPYDGQGGTNNRLSSSSSSTSVTRINSTSAIPSPVNTQGVGFKGLMRDSATAIRFQNLSTVTSTTQITPTISNDTQFILRAGASYGSGCVSMYYLGGSLSNSQMSNFRTYYNTFLTNIGLTAYA